MGKDLRKNAPRVAAWARRNPETRRAQLRRKWQRKAAHMRKLKARPCADCGVQYHYAVMQFDHVRGEKKFALGGGTICSHGYKAIEEEAAKCDVVCANCHAMRTWKRKTNGVESRA